MLHAGDPVGRIAQLLEVSPATVRSQVKAVRRKLQVKTQLGAVAALDDLLELEAFERDGAGGAAGAGARLGGLPQLGMSGSAPGPGRRGRG